MARLRRNLRGFAASWLLLQVMWLTALVPRDCCASHRPAHQRAEKPCHESTDHQPLSPSPDCRLSGVCDGPMASLFALLSNHGILPESAVGSPNAALRVIPPPVYENVSGRFEPPDPPPPRA